MGAEEAPANQRRVIVVGAGPVGLSAALALRARDLPVTLLEAEPADRTRPGSRAIYVHGASLRILERVSPGLGHELAEHGLVWPTKRTLWRGRQVYEQTYPPPPPTRLPHFTSLPQVSIEEHLLKACKARGVEIVWASPVVEVTTRAEGVTLTVHGGATWTAEYVVGADGARSAVRKLINASMDGDRSEHSYVIVDIAEVDDDPLPIERVFHYEHPAVARRNVLLVPFAGGWRVDLQCHDDDDVEALSSPEGVRAWIGRVMGQRYAERVAWISTYQFLQVVATRFVDAHRRVLLVGEAAHLFAPFGARGMNSGIADADLAARAIAQAIHDPGSAIPVVDDFDRERRTAARWNRDAAGGALEHLHAGTRGNRLRRFLAAVLALAGWRRAGKWLDTKPYGPRTRPPTATGTKY